MQKDCLQFQLMYESLRTQSHKPSKTPCCVYVESSLHFEAGLVSRGRSMLLDISD